jgi:hypothetical protein
MYEGRSQVGGGCVQGLAWQLLFAPVFVGERAK